MLVFSCLWVVGPTAFLAATILGVIVVFAGASALGHVGGYEPGVYAVAFRLALFVLLPALLICAHCATRGITEKGIWRWIPRSLDLPCLFFATVGLSVVTCIGAGAEWNGNPWLPDELATSTVLASLVVFGACAPLALLAFVPVLHWKAYHWASASGTRVRLLTVALGAGVIALNVMACGAIPGAQRSATAIAPPSLLPAAREDVDRARAADSVTEWSRLMLHAVGAPATVRIAHVPQPAPVPSASASAGAPNTDPPTPIVSAPSTKVEAEDWRFTACLLQLYAQADGEVATMLQRTFRIDRADASDLARETLLQVCLAHARKPYRNAAAALTEAARRRAVDDYRKIRRRECALPEEEGLVCGWQADQDEVRLDGERQALRRAVCGLPSRSRVALEAWARGESGKEIAAELGVSETEANNITQNAIKKLRRELERACASG